MVRQRKHCPISYSTSSPFWQRRRTGLKGYRLAAYDELPRSGVPELFRSREEFDAYVSALVRAGIIQDSSFIWWAMRPSLVNPTLELRAPDSCTLVEDTIAIAALYRTLARHLSLNPSCNAGLNAVQRALVVENKWQAQRHGANATFATENGGVSVADMLDRTIEDVPAISVFFKDEDGVLYHTYSTYSRGLDMLNGAYHYLDISPKGRDEDKLEYHMEWVRLRDEYA